MPEEDELILRVKLDDQATASLQKLRGNMQEMSGGGPRGAERIATSTKRASEDASRMGAAFGRAAGFAGIITAEATKMGLALVSRATDITALAEKFRTLDISARRAGQGVGQFKSDLSVFKQAGVDTESAARQLTAFSRMRADLQLQGSQTRRELLAGLRQPGEIADMMQHINKLMTLSQEEALNEAKKFSDDIEEWFRRQGDKPTGAARKARYLDIIGTPDLDLVRKDFKAISEEQKKQNDDNAKAAQEFLDASREIDHSWKQISERVAGIGLHIIGGTRLMQGYAAASKQFADQLERAQTIMQREGMQGIIRRLPAEEGRGAITAPLPFRILNWGRRRLGGPTAPTSAPLDQPPASEDKHTGAIEDNTEAVKSLTGKINFAPSGGLPAAGGAYGGVRGGGFGSLISAAGSSRQAISLQPYGSSVGAGVGSAGQPFKGPAGGGGPAGSGSGGSGELDRAAFDKTFAGTPLEGKADAVIAEARKNNIPPSLMAAIMAHETGEGRSKMLSSKNNPAGLMDPKANWMTGQTFGSVDEGIAAAGRTIAKNYRKGGSTIGGMADVYAPPKAANDPGNLNRHWAAGVTKYNQRFGGGAPGEAPDGLVRQMTEAMAPAGTRPGAGAGGVTTITTPSGRRLTVASKYAANFQGFVNDYEGAGGVIGPSSGGLAGRPHNPSYHPRGLAIDVNQVGYGVRSKTGVTLEQAKEDELAAKWGLFPGSRFGRRSDIGHFEVRNAEAARAAIDRQKLDRDRNQQNVKVDATGKLSVDVNAPAGTSVRAEGGGLFKRTSLKRKTSMEPASTGPSVGGGDEE